MNYKELEQEAKRLEEQIKDLKVKLEEQAEKKAYEVEVPEDIDDYYYTNGYGRVDYLEGYTTSYEKNIYIRGLAFKTEEEAEQYDRERILLFKLHKWAEDHNGGWTPNWKDDEEEKYTIRYDYKNNRFEIFYSYSYKEFSKLPSFISNHTAQLFIEEFGEEIKEVLFKC